MSVKFCELDSREIESAVITGYEKIAGVTLYAGDPVRLFLESLAYALTLQSHVINVAGQQGLLAMATGGHLDEVAQLLGTQRLDAAAARCMQAFELQEALGFDVVIPAGTRVTTGDSRALFLTQAELTIEAGETVAEVAVMADTAGAALNGLVSGQINVLVTPVPYIAKTYNTTPTVSGADTESDERLRARAHEAAEVYTCAGPVGSYRHLAMSAHQDVADVAVWTPEPGTVDIRPICKGGVLPSEEVLAVVRAALSADDVRPLTDTVIVAAPEAVDYEIHVSWSLNRTDEALQATVQRNVLAAVESYRIWQRSVPGRDINPTKLISLMEQAGARRVIVTSPEFTLLEPRQIANESSVQVTYLGLEAE